MGFDRSHPVSLARVAAGWSQVGADVCETPCVSLSDGDPGIPDWDGLVNAIGAVLDEIGGRMDLLTSAVGVPPGRQIAAGALARCRRLLLACIVLLERDLPDGGGALVRALFETWVNGVYALYGGKQAVDELISQYK